MNDAVLARWTHVTRDDAPHVVLPDGCRDLIRRESVDGAAHWSVSPLMDTATSVPCRRGTRLTGYRLRAGAVIGEAALLARVHGAPDADVAGMIESCSRTAAEEVAALAACRDVSGAARALGVGVRTLERRLVEATGRPPRWWRSLARARRAAARLDADASLAALADAAGYADQSHMCREFVRWFGLPPARLRRRADLLEQLGARGYGDDIGVQISTRNPASSRT